MAAFAATCARLPTALFFTILLILFSTVAPQNSVASGENDSSPTTDMKTSEMSSAPSTEKSLTEPLRPSVTQSEAISSAQTETTTSAETETTSVQTEATSSTQTEVTTLTQTETTQSVVSSTHVVTTTQVPCDPPAYHEFPPDLFSNTQRAQGYLVIHILVGMYMFFALAVVCDQYFVASMEKICQNIGLSEDVAGATFMAAGSSAPELFASLLGVFVAKGDVGTGTIVGSAVFNVLFVVGLCGLFAGKSVCLNWWPLLRDSSYYAFTVAVLIAIMADGEVTWLESLIMLLLYGLYIILMSYNVKLRIFLTEHTKLRLMDEITQSSQGILTHDDRQVHSDYEQFGNEYFAVDGTKKASSPAYPMNIHPPLDEIIRDNRQRVTLYEAALMMMSTRNFRPYTRFRSAGKRLVYHYRKIQREGYTPSVPQDTQRMEFASEIDDRWKELPNLSDGVMSIAAWAVSAPVLAVLHYTVPDCRKAYWEKWFLLTFITAMMWIAFFSYILVWMVTLVGFTCGIPDSVMGITFLAAGTSVPDAYASLIVARQGQADMAVSNSIGSNVFDVLIGLALPWFLQSAMVKPGSTVAINSGGMVYNVVLLFLSIAATLIAVHYTRWQLNKKLGLVLLSLYAVFLIFAILIEFNIFGFVNRPECDE